MRRCVSGYCLYRKARLNQQAGFSIGNQAYSTFTLEFTVILVIEVRLMPVTCPTAHWSGPRGLRMMTSPTTMLSRVATCETDYYSTTNCALYVLFSEVALRTYALDYTSAWMSGFWSSCRR